MIKNFHFVRDHLWRGSAPTPEDVIALHKELGIQHIISLDELSGENISNICKKLNIKQTIIPLDSNLRSVKYLLKHNIHSLINNDVPTFVHCRRGKDRTGLFLALCRCILDKWDCKKAIKEAEKLGFGTGLEYPLEKFYIKLIKRACTHHQDDNHLDDIRSNIADLNREYRDYTLDSLYPLSWSPYTDISTRYYPGSQMYKEYPEQYVTREEYGLKGINNKTQDSNMIPQVGIYDANTQITNFVGPSLVGGGFV